MSQEDKPCSQHPDAPHGFDRNASHNAGRYVCECEGWEPVAAQEPVGCVHKDTLAMLPNLRPDDGGAKIWPASKAKYDTAYRLIYANAAPCARCAELEAEIMCIHNIRDNKPWRELSEAQAKITEQAAEIEQLDDEVRLLQKVAGEDQAEITEQADRIQALEAEAADRESFLKTLADTCTEAERIAIERAGRIDVLESECRKLRDALSEAEAFCKRKDITIDHQRKVIELSKSVAQKNLEFFRNAKLEGLAASAEEDLAAIAELEKGVVL